MEVGDLNVSNQDPKLTEAVDRTANWRTSLLAHSLLAGPIRNPRLWITLGWLEVIQSYRRSFLGPMWITANMAIFSIAMTLVYGAIFGIPSKTYSAYIISGMIGWLWVSALLVDVGNTFITNATYIKALPFDKAQLIWGTAFRQVIVLGHNLLVYAAAVLLGLIDLNFYTLLFIPSVMLFFCMTIPLIALLSILFARYRDLPRLVSSIIIVVMLLTPVFWTPSLVSGWRAAFYLLNPFYYLIQFLRRPLLGEPPDILITAVFLVFVVVVWVLGMTFYKRYERYVAFWI
jgi:ABC-type polysaccharide/polyol phosphate export permease|tara:strand:- start:180 stop:1043 length:864 start_codon:yes stop_codon:yes gene_type:complete